MNISVNISLISFHTLTLFEKITVELKLIHICSLQLIKCQFNRFCQRTWDGLYVVCNVIFGICAVIALNEQSNDAPIWTLFEESVTC